MRIADRHIAALQALGYTETEARFLYVVAAHSGYCFGASQKLRQQRLGHADGSPVTETIYTHVISEDGKRVAAQLGNAVWGVLDAIGRKKQNGSEVEPPKPFYIN